MCPNPKPNMRATTAPEAGICKRSKEDKVGSSWLKKLVIELIITTILTFKVRAALTPLATLEAIDESDVHMKHSDAVLESMNMLRLWSTRANDLP
jgi:hypothetical protein